MKRKTIRNSCIFSIVALSCGWLGLQVDRNMGPQPEGETLGMGLWLVLPLVSTILLRLFAGDGWEGIGLRPNFKGNFRWYAISLLIFPVVTLAVLLLGKISGWVDLSHFDTAAYFTEFAVTLIPNFIKNIFEEFVWRGYLSSKLIQLNLKDNWIYLIVGGIWGAWHLPYYLFFLPERDIISVLPVDRLTFAFIAIITMIFWTVMYVELYRITQSIWPLVLVHMMEDSIVNHLIIDKHIQILPGKEILISPIAGIITSILYLIIGYALRKARKTREAKAVVYSPAGKYQPSL